MLAAPLALTSATATLILLYMMRSSGRGASYRIGRAGCRATSKHMRPSQRAGLGTGKRLWRGRDVYFPRNRVLNGDFAKLSVGARVSFVEETGEKGAQASTVRLVGKHSLRPQNE